MTTTDHEVNLGTAAKIIGISYDLLRELCRDGTVPAHKAPGAAHMKVYVSQLPHREQLVETLQARLEEYVQECLAATKKVAAELEAIELDCREVLESGALGNDISQASYSRSAFGEALSAMREASVKVSLAHRYLAEAKGA